MIVRSQFSDSGLLGGSTEYINANKRWQIIMRCVFASVINGNGVAMVASTAGYHLISTRSTRTDT